MTVRILALLRPLGILVLAAAIAFFMISSRPELVARSVDQPLPLVRVQPITLGDVPVTVTAYGNVEAWRDLTLSAQVSGRVDWRAANFEPGVLVAAGDTLLRIDDTDYRLALAEARQALASAELSLADAKSLRQAARVDEAEAAVAAAQARIARAQRDLQNTEVRSPFAAVVDTQSVEVGQFVSIGMQLGRVLGSDKAEIRLPVTAQDVVLLGDAGAPVVLSTTVGPRERRWEGRLVRIEKRVDDQTRVFPVVVEVLEPLDTQQHASPLPFGLFVRAQIEGRPVADAVLVPQSALHGSNDVFLLVDGALVRRAVTVERVSEGMALVTAGLGNGDQVVTTRLDLMFAGMAVDLIDE